MKSGKSWMGQVLGITNGVSIGGAFCQGSQQWYACAGHVGYPIVTINCTRGRHTSSPSARRNAEIGSWIGRPQR